MLGDFSLTCASFPQGSIKKEFPQNLGGSDTCYFCQKRVYVMERLSAEGKFFHRSCFKCEHCATTLRLSAYAYALEDGELPMPRCTRTRPPLLAHTDAFLSTSPEHSHPPLSSLCLKSLSRRSIHRVTRQCHR